MKLDAKSKRTLGALRIFILLALALFPLAGCGGAEPAWTLENGVLTVSVKGAMPDYELREVSETEVLSTAPWAEESDDITSVALADGVTRIGNYAFAGFPNLASVTIPDSVTKIGEGAFSGCASLAGASIPASVTEIEDGACAALANVNFSEGVTEIGSLAFVNCDSLTSVYIPDSVSYIGMMAFDCANLTSASVPATADILGAFPGTTVVTLREG